MNGSTSAHTLAVLCRLSYRQVDHWTARGFLVPEAREHARSGHPRMYPQTEVTVARIMAALVHAGVKVEAAAVAARSATTTSDGFALELLPGVAVFGRLP